MRLRRSTSFRFERLLDPLVANVIELHYLAILELDGKLGRTRCNGARLSLVNRRRVIWDHGLWSWLPLSPVQA